MARQGDEVRLRCPIEGRPSPMVSWSREGEDIDYGWTRFRASRKSLRIREVGKDDAGVYRCKGVNGFGSAEMRIGLMGIGRSNIFCA